MSACWNKFGNVPAAAMPAQCNGEECTVCTADDSRGWGFVGRDGEGGIDGELECLETVVLAANIMLRKVRRRPHAEDKHNFRRVVRQTSEHAPWSVEGAEPAPTKVQLAIIAIPIEYYLVTLAWGGELKGDARLTKFPEWQERGARECRIYPPLSAPDNESVPPLQRGRFLLFDCPGTAAHGAAFGSLAEALERATRELTQYDAVRRLGGEEPK